MKQIRKHDPCPCGTGKTYDQCCGPLLAGRQKPSTAEQLMRSRFTANVIGKGAYLQATWHPDTCPAGEIREFLPWFRLEVLAVKQGQAGDARGEVEFKAWYQQGVTTGLLHERSRFIRLEDGWRYVDGLILPATPAAPGKVGRNSPCPCGSGKKFKRCCLQR